MMGRSRMMMAAAVIILLSSSVQIGFATTEYTATTTSASSTISAGYFTTGLYIYDTTGETYNPVSASALNSGTVSITSSGDTKTIANGSYKISVDNLYMKITETNMPANCTYAPSVSIVVKNSQGTPLTGVTSSITAYNSLDETVSSLSANIYYRILVQVTFTNSSFTGNTLTEDVTITNTVNSTITGNYIESNGISITDIVISSDGYSTATTPSERQGTYGDHESITIINGDGPGVSDSSGHVALNFTIPGNREFIISFVPDGHGKSYFTVSLKIGDNTPMSHPITINGQKAQYLYKSGANSMSHTETFSNITNSQWFTGTGNITVNITNRDGYTVSTTAQLDIVFK